MKFTFLSLFPDIIEAYLNSSIIKRSIEKGVVSSENINIRDFATDKHKVCDDKPFGGGAGMVMKIEPIAAAIEKFKGCDSYVIYPSPSGMPFNQAKAKELSSKKHLILIAGRYEGIDQRIIDQYVDEEISLGNYVMASGELSSMVIVDSVMRLVDGSINAESLKEESFEDGLLEYPQYTRPADFNGVCVPEVLLSGNHKEINEWRMQKRIEKTIAINEKILHNSK